MVFQDQRRAIQILKDIVKGRLSSGDKQDDFLDVVLADMNKESSLFDLESVAYLLYALLFASFETVSMALALTINFVSEHPLVLQDLMVCFLVILHFSGHAILEFLPFN